MGMYPVRGAWEWVCTQSREPGNGYVPSQGSLGMGMYPVREPGNEYVPSQGTLGMGMYPVRGACEWVCTQ